jgi:ribonuclease HII
MHAAGVDENGLGALLGPLVVTIAHAQGSRSALAALNAPSKSARTVLFDSKALVSFRNSSLGEAWARALYPHAESVDELLHTVLRDSLAQQQAPCPRPPGAPNSIVAQCFRLQEPFAASAQQVDACAEAYARFRSTGIERIDVRSAVVCNNVLNAARAEGRSRFQTNLNTMEKLLDWAGTRAAGNLDAVCGKVGGYNVYPPAFSLLQGRVTKVHEEGRAQSVYSIANVGRVNFARDADAQFQLVSLASLVGKWLRDHWMRRIIAHHQASSTGAPSASGYHDVTTKRFVQLTSKSRTAKEFPDACFLRF